MDEALHVIFAGTPDFSIPPLEALLSSGYHIDAVYTQPDRPAGRGRHLRMSPVKDVALAHNIPVLQPKSLRGQAEIEEFAEFQADIMVVVAYGLILPTAILQAPRLGCINIHASCLPRWRGAAPIQRAMLAGDNTTGITIMQMDAGLDTGAMLLQTTCQIAPTDCSADLHDRLTQQGATAMLEVIQGLQRGDMQAEAQDDSLATYASKIDKSEAVLDWGESAVALCRKVQAFNPWPVAQTLLNGKVLRIWTAVALDESCDEIPGTVIATSKDGVDVATGDGVLRVKTLQIAGKRVLAAVDFINARPLKQLLLGK